MVQKGQKTPAEAHKCLKGTFSKDKHEILHSQFQMNYNDEPEIYKRGNILIRVSFNKKREKKAMEK